MTRESTLRFGAQTDEVTSLLRIVNLVRTGEATPRPSPVTRPIMPGWNGFDVRRRFEQRFDATFPRWFADGRPTIDEVMPAS